MKTFNFYCDESCHLENDHLPFMLIGYVSSAYNQVKLHKDNIEIFSVKTRDQKKRQDIIRTYIYDKEQKYVIVLDPHRSRRDYYLLTAYHLNKGYGEKQLLKKLKNKLPDIQ